MNRVREVERPLIDRTPYLIHKACRSNTQHLTYLDA
jgi:hypothetical protein